MAEQQESYDVYVQQRLEKGALNQISPAERFVALKYLV